MKVAFTGAAETDLETIGDYIALSNPFRACLHEMPKAFPLLEGHEPAGIRRRVHGNYLIFYRIGGDTVEILRVLHGAMEHERLLFPEG